MAVSERISEETYLRLALRDPDRQWELHRGRLREKPGMSVEHNDYMFHLGMLLQQQLDRSIHRIRVNGGRLRHPAASYYIPAVAVIPVELDRPQRGQPGRLEVYATPLPLVVELWFRSTGDYDVEEKLLGYQQRGDLDIWRLHPYERTLTRWVRRPDGSYAETIHTSGTVDLSALPGVRIDLDQHFGLLRSDSSEATTDEQQ